jgi:hypothetical protein
MAIHERARFNSKKFSNYLGQGRKGEVWEMMEEFLFLEDHETK